MLQLFLLLVKLEVEKHLVNYNFTDHLAITGPQEVSPSPETVGLVPRALECMFEMIRKEKEANAISAIRIQASYLEIYNENVLDLLNPQNSGLPVRWSAERGFFVEHLYIVDCDSLDDCLAVLEEGDLHIFDD
jgi:hypothetical protein